MTAGPARPRLPALFAAAKDLIRREPFLAAVTLLALLYVAASLSPSAYALVLRSFGVAEDGLLYGSPQYIRSDEYAIWTPTVQAVVRSDFGPVNVTSLYAERFRSLSALPLADWGIVFKPAFWPFFAISPARAFSAYHAFHYWVFLVGWVLLLRRLGVGRSEAVCAAILLLATSWVQMWWTSLGPILTYAPFFVLPLLWPLRGVTRAFAAFYVAAAWLLDGIFYPPLYLASSLALLLAIFAFRPEALRPGRLIPWAVGALGGIGVAALYLWDSLLATIGSTMHGMRNLGGGDVTWQSYLGTFLPSFPFHGWDGLYGRNSCETSSTGSILWLLILCFALPVSFGAWRQDAAERGRLRRALGLVLFFLVASVWMLAPLPAIFGKLVLWHLTPPTRLLVLPGLLAFFLALLILPRLELRWSAPRASLFSLLVLGAFLYTEWPLLGPHEGTFKWKIHLHTDLLLIPLVFALPLFERARRWVRVKLAAAAHEASGGEAGVETWRRLSPVVLLAAAAVANGLFFSLYNPLQSSQAIFAEHDSAELRTLRTIQEAHPRGWLVVGGHHYYGSVLNGLGFRSVNHSLLDPEVARFGHFFPELSPEDRNRIFNRYLNVQVSPFAPPGWKKPLFKPIQPVDTSVLVPPEPFLPPLQAVLAAESPPPLPDAPESYTRTVTVGPKWWLLEIAGPIDGLGGEVAIEINTDPPARRLIRTWRVPQETVPLVWTEEAYSRVFVELAAPAGFVPQPVAGGGLGWCVTLDGEAGKRQIAPLQAEGRSTCR